MKNSTEIKLVTQIEANKQLVENISLIPVVPTMQSALGGPLDDLADALSIARSELPLGCPLEHGSYVVTSYFGDRVFNHNTQYHRGIDIVPPNRNIAEKIIATEDGIIEKIGISPVYGKYLILDHLNGYKTFYAHFSKIFWQNIKTRKTEGEAVTKGTPLGIIGATGLATGVHLHYEVRYMDSGQPVVINPLPLLDF